MMTGGSIIIPIDMRMEATTMSMTMNGMKMRKPISKARLSSLIIKAGMRVIVETSNGSAGRSCLAMSRNSCKSLSRTLANMNCLNGMMETLNASSSSIVPSVRGLMPVS